MILLGIILSSLTILTSPVSAQTQELKLLSYNAGLAHGFVYYAKERRTPIIEALNQSDADVICLQEVWKKSDRRKMRKGIDNNYPFQVYSPIKQQKTPKTPACRFKDLFGEGKIVTCFQKTCKGKKGDEFTSCVVNDCRASLQNLKKEKKYCAQALMAQVGKNPIISIVRLLNPFKRPGVFTYKGSVGLAIASKYPIVASKFIDMKEQSSLNHRGLLLAELDVNGTRQFIGCTHIAANLTETAPYAGEYSSWEEENQVQAKIVAEEMKRFAGNRPAALLGDFNCGFANADAGVQGDFESGCMEILNAGFRDPISEQAPACSVCQDNNLNSEKEIPKLIDHVFTYGFGSEETHANIVLNQTVKLKSGKESKLSDHYGVMVSIPVK